MKDKYYGLTNKPNDGVKDKAPEWMNSLFEKKEAKPKNANPFRGVDDPILNPKKNKVRTCSSCGATLKDNEVGTCSKCH